jgi:hypothetical protein
MTDNSVLYTAVYADVDGALADLKDLEQLHKDEVIGKYDAAVIDKQNGEPHIVKRVDRPAVRVIPEWFGKGALPRSELHDAGQQLGPGEAGLIAVGEPTLAQGFEKAVKRADRMVKHDLDTSVDELAQEMTEAVKPAKQ